MRRSPGSLPLLALLAVVAGCAPPEVSRTLVVQTEDATPEQIARTAQVLTARFEEILPTRRSSVSPTVNGNTISFAFRGEAPSADALRPLTSTRGALRIFRADQTTESWVTDADVRDAVLAMTGEGGPVVNVRLSPEAGDRLLKATSSSIGRTLVTTLDGRQILTAEIRAPFARQFVFSAQSKEEGRLLQILLPHGRLPVAVTSFDYRDAKTAR